MSVAPTAARQLRPYQREAVDAVITAWANEERRVGVVLPTGAGKSTVIAQTALEAYRLGLRVVMLAHRGELLNQMADAVLACDPTLPAGTVGIVRAEQDEHTAPIVAATLQTLTSDHRRLALGERDVVIWDEVHHAGAEGWHNVVVELGMYSGAFVLGLTATMRREDGKRLGDSIERVVYEKDLRWAIDSGYLVQPHGLTVKIPDLNLADVRTVAGDFHQGQLEEVMEASRSSVVQAILGNAADRRAIVFAAGVDNAHGLADELSAVGITAEAVTGAMSMERREQVYARYRSGETQMLVTVQVLTEGADFPMCDAVVMARPTRSQTLYSQMVGRALRLYPGKTDALVLDLTGTARVLKLITLTDLDGQAPRKTVTPDGEEIEPDPADEEAAPRERKRREGPIELTTVDLLKADHTTDLWLETPGGIPFLDCGNYLVFVWPKDTEHGERLWAAGWMTSKGEKSGDWCIPEEDGRWVNLEQAVTDATEFAHDSFTVPQRNASWRRSQPPSEAQLNFARMLGIPDCEDKTKARLSDDISVTLAARRLDS